MTSTTKRKIKRFIIRTEMWWYAITGIGFIIAIAGLWIARRRSPTSPSP